MKKIFVLMLCLILVAFIKGTVISSSERSQDDDIMCVPMGNILLEAPASVESKKSPVMFPHSRHFGIECKTCHHTWQGTDNIIGCMTSGCHDLTTSPTQAAADQLPESAEYRYFKTAYHNMCIGCHKEIKAQNKKLEMSRRLVLQEEISNTGPIGCVECHPRQ